MVNTNLSGQLKFLNGRFGGGLRYKVSIYGLFIEKIKKYCFVAAKGTFYLSTDFCITVFFNHQGQNIITIKPNRVFFHRFETITFMNL